MRAPWIRTAAVVAACAAGAALVAAATVARVSASDPKQESKRPRFTLRAQPAFGMTPLRVVLTAELTGGEGDIEEYYCPTVRWEWDDDTTSEATLDCPPYEAGTSEIKRRWVTEHRFDRAGSYKIYIRLKHHDKEIAAASTLIRLQPGPGDMTP